MRISAFRAVSIVALLGFAIACAWNIRFVAAGQSEKQKSASPAAPKADDPATQELKSVLAKAAKAANAAKPPKERKESGERLIQKKVGELTHIAFLQAECGDKAGAIETFRETLQATTEIQADEARWRAINTVGIFQARAGLIDDARRTSERIVGDGQAQEQRSSIMVEVAGAMAASGDVAGAVKVAMAIPPRVVKRTQLNVDQIEHQDMGPRNWAFRKISEAQQKAGDLAGAVKSAQELNDGMMRFVLLQDLVLAFAKAGDKAGAEKLFNEMRTDQKKQVMWPEPKDPVYFMMQAAIGDATGAMASVEKIEPEARRVAALTAIARGLSYRQEWKKKP
jgi:hypothetical protein